MFSRIQLALFGEVPWRADPVMPVEIMHLPRWFFFHLSKVSYWSRTVMVPLLVLMALRPQARNPRAFHCRAVHASRRTSARLVPRAIPLRLGASVPRAGHVLRTAGAFFPKRARGGDRRGRGRS